MTSKLRENITQDQTKRSDFRTAVEYIVVVGTVELGVHCDSEGVHIDYTYIH